MEHAFPTPSPAPRLKPRRVIRQPWFLLIFACMAAVLVAMHLVFAGFFANLREKTYDAYQIARPMALEIDQVAVVTIDEDSLARFGRWPWPRRQVGDLVDAVAASGAAAIGLDLFFAEPDVGQGGAESDSALADAIADAPSVLALSLDPYGGPLAVDSKAGWSVVGLDPAAAEAVSGGISPLPKLAQASHGFGIVRALPDADGTIREVPLVWAESRDGAEIRLWPAFAMELLRVAQGAGSYTLRLEGARTDAVRVGEAIIPLDDDGRVRIIDTATRVPHVSAADLLEHGSADTLAGKIAIIAVDAAGLDQYHLTSRGGHRLGADIHAIVTTQMLQARYLREVPHARLVERGSFLGGCAVLIIILSIFARRPLFAAGYSVPVMLAPAIVCAFVYLQKQVLIDGVQPTAGLVIMGAAGGYALYREAERRRRVLQQQFSQFLSPEVVRHLAETDTAAALRVEDREITAMLVDIRGFTALTEMLDAEKTVAVVNHFLEIANREIFARDGTVDKYIGDAVLAFWNAPLEAPDHPDRAIECACAVIEAVEKANTALAARGLPPIGVVAAIETGFCSVGNMGTEKRIDYTAIGPAINIVSRLETETKRLGEKMLIGPGTAARASTPLRQVETVHLHGMEETVCVYKPQAA